MRGRTLLIACGSAAALVLLIAGCEVKMPERREAEPDTSALPPKPNVKSAPYTKGPADWLPLYTPTPEEDAFLDDLEHRIFNYFWNEVFNESGVAFDHTDNKIGKVAATGFELAAITIGVKRGWISYDEGYTRVYKILDFFWDNPADASDRFVEGHFGLFWHFVDGETGVKKPIDCVAVCDSADFIAGALVAGQFFRGTPIQQLAQRLYDDVQWDRFVSDDPAGGPGLMSYGWVPLHVSETYFNVDGLLPFNMKGFDDNSLLTYAMALGSDTHPIPSKTWKLYVDSYKNGEYEGFPCVEAGQIFCRQVPQSFIRMSRKRDRKIDYFQDAVYAYLADRAFNRKVNGYPPEVWGLNDCFGKDSYTHSAPPGPINNDGTVSSAGFVGAITHVPGLSFDAMTYIKNKYGDRMWHEYGFTSSLNPKNDFISPLYVGIELRPMIMMVENFRSGMIWDLFMRNRCMKNFIQRAGMAGVIDDFELPPEAPPYAMWSASPGEVKVDPASAEHGRFGLSIASTSAHVRIDGRLTENDLLKFNFQKYLSVWAVDMNITSCEARIDGAPVVLSPAGKLSGAKWDNYYFSMPGTSATSVLTAVAFEAGVMGTSPALDNVVLEENTDLEGPTAITDFAAAPGALGSAIDLHWTVPSGGGIDNVASFLIATSPAPLQNGDAKLIEVGARANAGEQQTHTLMLDSIQKLYLSIAAIDEHGHRGPFSRQVECAPNPKALDKRAYDFENQSLVGWRPSTDKWQLHIRQFRTGATTTRALEVKYVKEGAWDYIVVSVDPVMVAHFRYITMKVVGKVELLGKLWVSDEVQSEMDRQTSTSDTTATVLKFDTQRATLSPGDRDHVQKLLLFPAPGKDGTNGVFIVDDVQYSN